MSPTPTLLQTLLRGLLLRLVAVLDAALGARVAVLRLVLRGLPEGGRRHRALSAQLRGLERARAVLANPDSYAAPRFAGLCAEVARVRNDPGRRALPRRRIHPNPFFALPAARPAPRAELEAPEGRCTTTI